LSADMLYLRNPACLQSGPRLLSWEPLGVFGADMFRPFNQRAAIRYGRRPGHRKGACILDRELELQVLAPNARVPGPQGDLILLCVPLHAFFRGFVIEQPISFDHVQSLRVWRAKPVDHGNRPDLEPDCVYYQRVTFVVADGISIPGRRNVTGMKLIHADATDLMIVVIKNRDLVRLLQQLHSSTRKDIRHPLGRTLVARVRIAGAG